MAVLSTNKATCTRESDRHASADSFTHTAFRTSCHVWVWGAALRALVRRLRGEGMWALEGPQRLRCVVGLPFFFVSFFSASVADLRRRVRR